MPNTFACREELFPTAVAERLLVNVCLAFFWVVLHHQVYSVHHWSYLRSTYAPSVTRILLYTTALPLHSQLAVDL